MPFGIREKRPMEVMFMLDAFISFYSPIFRVFEVFIHPPFVVPLLLVIVLYPLFSFLKLWRFNG